MIPKPQFLLTPQLPIILNFRCAGLWVQGWKPKGGIQAKVMGKMLREKSGKKKYYVGGEFPKLNTNTTLFDGKVVRKVQPRRMAVLNKLFMKNISDLVAVGDTSELLNRHGFEITKVSISIDYSHLNVFWHSTTEETDQLEDALKEDAFRLRHELSQLNIMGVIPRIQFVKDKDWVNDTSLDKLFKVADYGPDPLEEENETLPDVSELPGMGCDVYGLNHSRIMDTVKRGMQKAKAIHRFQGPRSIEET